MKTRLRNESLHLIIIAVVLLAAFALRVWGIHWNLPYADHPDEGVIVDHATAFLRTGDWNPRFFQWPSLHMYVLAIIYGIQFLIGQAQGIYSSIQQIPVSTFTFTTAPEFYIVGRVVTALFGTATVGLVYLIGRNNWSRTAGLIGAALLAVSPLSIENSHYIAPDVPLAFLVTVSLYFSLESLRSKSTRLLILAGLFAGLAMSTKYNGALAAVAVAVVWALRAFSPVGEGRPAWKRMFEPLVFATPLAFAVGFIAFTPFSVLDWAEFLADLRYQTSIYDAVKNIALPDLPVWLNYVIRLWWRHEWAIMAAGSAGAILLLWRRSRPAIALVVFCVAYVAFFGQYRSFFLRNMVAILPPLAFMGGWALTELLRVAKLYAPKVQVSLAVVAISAAVIPGLYTGIAEDRYMAGPDSRALAAEWIEKNSYNSGRIAVELHPLQWQGNSRVLAEGRPVLSRKPSWYRAHGYSYLVFDSNAHATDKQFIDSIPKKLKLVEMFGGDKHGGLGPDIYVYETGGGANDLKVQNRVGALFGGQLDFVGYDVGLVEKIDDVVSGSAGTLLTPGQILGLNLYWQAAVDIEQDWTAFIHLVGPDGSTAAQRDTLPQDGQALMPTSKLEKGGIFYGPFNVPLPAGIQPGKYKMVFGLYDAASGARLPVIIDGKQSDSLILREIEVK